MGNGQVGGGGGGGDGGGREDVGVKCQMGEGGETRLSPFTFFT